MNNRYGDEYHWEQLEPNKYKFCMTGTSLEYGRRGGKEGQKGLDDNDLGMFDPSGGPYISLGMELFQGEWISHIALIEGDYIVTTSEVRPI